MNSAGESVRLPFLILYGEIDVPNRSIHLNTDGLSKPGKCRELAHLAWTARERHQRRAQPPRRVEPDQERALEGGVAGTGKLDADRLGRPHLSHPIARKRQT